MNRAWRSISQLIATTLLHPFWLSEIVCLQADGTEIKTVFKPGEAFVEGANEPHYVENVGKELTIVLLTVASVEGTPTTEFIDE